MSTIVIDNISKQAAEAFQNATPEKRAFVTRMVESCLTANQQSNEAVQMAGKELLEFAKNNRDRNRAKGITPEQVAKDLGIPLENVL